MNTKINELKIAMTRLKSAFKDIRIDKSIECTLNDLESIASTISYLGTGRESLNNADLKKFILDTCGACDVLNTLLEELKIELKPEKSSCNKEIIEEINTITKLQKEIKAQAEDEGKKHNIQETRSSLKK